MPCGVGEPGDLEIRGASVFAGYFDPTLPERFDRSAFTADGWLRTGDVAYFGASGGLFVLGRKRAIQILEYLDRKRRTRRVGDARVVE